MKHLRPLSSDDQIVAIGRHAVIKHVEDNIARIPDRSFRELVFQRLYKLLQHGGLGSVVIPINSAYQKQRHAARYYSVLKHMGLVRFKRSGSWHIGGGYRSVHVTPTDLMQRWHAAYIVEASLRQ